MLDSAGNDCLFPASVVCNCSSKVWSNGYTCEPHEAFPGNCKHITNGANLSDLILIDVTVTYHAYKASENFSQALHGFVLTAPLPISAA
jgi:hypothetical protein